MTRTELAAVAVRIAVFGLLFWSTGLLGRLTIMDGTSVSLVWPAAGVAAGWLYVAHRGRWWAADVAALSAITIVVNTLTGASLWLALGFVLSNVAQALVFVRVFGWLRRRRAAGPAALVCLADLWALLLATAVSAAVGTVIGPTAVWAIHGAWSWPSTLLWGTRNLAGIMLIGSAILLVADRVAPAGGLRAGATAIAEALRSWQARAKTSRGAELAALLVASAGIYVLAFVPNQGLPLMFLLLTVTVWAGLRFDTLLVAGHGLWLGTMAIGFTLAGEGPFALVADDATRGLVAQAFICMVALAGLALALSRDERVALTDHLRQAEQEAAAQARLMTTLVDSMNEGLAVIDENGAFLLRNPAGRALLGSAGGDLESVGSSDHYGLFETDGTRLPDERLPYLRALAGDPVDGDDLVIRNPGVPEGRVLNVSATPLPPVEPGAPRTAVVVYHDVTAERRHRDELASFAGIVAHDLLNPLATIDGWAESLSDGLLDASYPMSPDEAEMSLARIRRSAARMRHLINDLLAYTTARDVTLAATDLDLTALVTEVTSARVDQHRATTEAATAPVFEFDELGAVRADPVLTRQVLDNVIGNAVKYVDPDVTPHITIDTHATADGMAAIEITDNGIGIPDGQHAAIFDNFHRAHREHGYQGTGLGLAICKRVAERHGGTITATDNPAGRGTRITLVLPQASPADAETYGAEPGATRTPVRV